MNHAYVFVSSVMVTIVTPFLSPWEMILSVPPPLKKEEGSRNCQQIPGGEEEEKSDPK